MFVFTYKNIYDKVRVIFIYYFIINKISKFNTNKIYFYNYIQYI